MKRACVSVIAILCLLVCDSARGDEFVAKFLQTNCVRCHGAKTAKAHLMLHKLTGSFNTAEVKVWEAVAGQLKAGTMPPKGQAKPNAADVRRVLAWIESGLKRSRLKKPSAAPIKPNEGNGVPHEVLFGASAKTSKPATPARIWRVRPSIYESFVERATRRPFHKRFSRRAKLLSTPWGLTGKGIKDYSALHWIGEAETELLISNAMRVAEMMGEKRGRHGRESQAFRNFARGRHDVTGTEAESLITVGFQQILRRKPKPEELKRHAAFLKKSVTKLGRKQGMETSLAAIVLHPEAVFRFELGTGDPDKYVRVKLAPVELAYAIAFALTDKGPDDELLKAARTGQLMTRKQVHSHITRLLNDGDGPRRNILRFFQEYFGYTTAPQVFKDLATRRKARLRGNYSPQSLVSDTDHLVLHFLKRDKHVLRELLTTHRSFVSTGRGRWNKLADLRKRAKAAGRKGPITPFLDKRNGINLHYNIEPHEWSPEMPFPLNKKQRAGILTQPSWLIAHSTNFENHAIHRGKWIRERLLGGTIPNTPITVEAQLPDDETLTLREKMRVTRQSVCWKCHQQMDPLGLAFEAYDHFGRHRTSELGKPAVTTGALAGTRDAKLDGPVTNAVELMHRLAKSRRVQQVFIRHAFRYFLGRNETPSDAATLIAADEAYTKSDGSMKALLVSLLSSDAFLYRRPLKTTKTVGRIANPSIKK